MIEKYKNTGRNILFHKKSLLLNEDVLNENVFEDEIFDLIIISTPYNVDVKYKVV